MGLVRDVLRRPPGTHLARECTRALLDAHKFANETHLFLNFAFSLGPSSNLRARQIQSAVLKRRPENMPFPYKYSIQMLPPA